MNSFTDSHTNFTETKAYKIIKNFIFEIDNHIKTSKENIEIDSNDILFKIKEIVENTPLSNKPGRFANPAMVEVLEKIENITDNVYLKNSFGNKIRMDFGTGHELNFLCYLYTQVIENKHQNNINENIIGSLDLRKIKSYVCEYSRIIRFFIKKFNVEAAGSRGVWSIDDYQLLPYLFGSSENFEKTYSIDLISNGLFKEAESKNPSIKLKGLCKMPWKSINIELLKFYDEEVLSKFVVTQHFIYSDLLPNTIEQNL